MFVIKLSIQKCVMNKLLLIILLIIIIMAVIGPFFLPHPLEADLEESFQKPCLAHILGTDNQGRDVLSRVVYGARISLGIGLLATTISLSVGLILGLVAGYKGGMFDRILCMLIDITLSFPSLLLAIGIMVVLPSGMWTVVLALTLVGWAGFARFTRGQVWNLKRNGYVEAAQAVGVGSLRIMIRHLLPNCLPLIIVAGFLRLGTFILSEAGLSFLGLGVPPPTPTWGGMINYGREFIHVAPWIVIFPGLMLALTVISCNMLGDTLRDKLDPKNKKG